MRLFDFLKLKKIDDIEDYMDDAEECTVELTEAEMKVNKMWDLWVEGKADSPAAELMKYQSEINNGGHDQYFLEEILEQCDDFFYENEQEINRMLEELAVEIEL